jgi:hypothetical protein
MRNLVQDLIDREAGWLAMLENDLKIHVSRDGDVVSLKYNQIESPMHEPIVQQCRGMVVDVARGRVIAWPYNKFWNHGEHLAAPIDWSSARVFEKLDGSLMILHWNEAAWSVASSGNPTAGGSFGFAGDVRTFRDAFWSTFESLGMRLPPDSMRDTTFMFELCDTPNRVIVRHERPRIVLHGARRLTTGLESAHGFLCATAESLGWECVQTFPFTSLVACDEAVTTLNPLEQEGYVVVDDAFNRVKIKSPRYVALHHLKGDLMTQRRAIELWQTGEVSELLSNFPERKPDVRPVHDELDSIAEQCVRDYRANMPRASRKDFALAIRDRRWSAVLFKMLGVETPDVDSAKKIMRESTTASLERLLVR